MLVVLFYFCICDYFSNAGLGGIETFQSRAEMSEILCSDILNTSFECLYNDSTDI